MYYRSLYGIEEEAVRDYFPLPHVLKNVFGLMEEHYGLVFKGTRQIKKILFSEILFKNSRTFFSA